MRQNKRAEISSRRRRASKGSALIETSLVFLIFFYMLIGAFDFGQFLFMHQALVERTRSAARWGSVNDPTNATSIKNMVMYNQSTTPGLGTSSYFNLTTSNVDVSTSGYGTDNYTLNVKVSGYSYVVLSPGLTGTFTGPPITVNIPLGLYN